MGGRCWYVEDSTEWQSAVADALHAVCPGVELRVFPSVEEFRQAVFTASAGAKPGVVVTGIDLGRQSPRGGLEVAHLVRERIGNIPVIALSGAALPAVLETSSDLKLFDRAFSKTRALEELAQSICDFAGSGEQWWEHATLRGLLETLIASLHYLVLENRELRDYADALAVSAQAARTETADLEAAVDSWQEYCRELRLRIAELEGATQVLWAQLSSTRIHRRRLRAAVDIIALAITFLQGPAAAEDVGVRLGILDAPAPSAPSIDVIVQTIEFQCANVNASVDGDGATHNRELHRE